MAFMGSTAALSQRTLRAAPAAQKLEIVARRTIGVPKKVKAKKAPKPAPYLGLYPEYGTYPGSGEDSPLVPFVAPRNAEREVIHGRFAMLGVTGAWAAENGTGVPWFEAGKLCTPDSCQNFLFPGAPNPLAPGLDSLNFYVVLAIEILLVGTAEAYRTGLTTPNPFDDVTQGDVYPGARFDPFNLSEGADVEELKIKELKHCRLAMFAWLGLMAQAGVTKEGPIANWSAHVADPIHVNLLSPTYLNY